MSNRVNFDGSNCVGLQVARVNVETRHASNGRKFVHKRASRRAAAAMYAGVAAATLLSSTFSASAQNVTFTLATTASGSWSNSANWVGGVVAEGAGNVALLGAGGVTITLDTPHTLGQLADRQGSARALVVNSNGASALTLDNTGNTSLNPIGTSNSFLGSTASGPLTFNPSIILANTDLDIHLGGSTGPVLNLGVAGTTNTITATSARTINIYSNSGGANGITINHNIGGTGSMITLNNIGTGSRPVTLAGVLGPNVAITQSSATTVLRLDKSNNYTGATTINAGSIQVRAANAVSSASSVTINNSAILNIGSFNDAIGALSGTGFVESASLTPTLSIGGNNADGNFSGILRNPGGVLSVSKIGTGTQTFSGQNSFTGKLSILQGTLAVPTINNFGTEGALGNSSFAIEMGNTGGVRGVLLYTGTDPTPVTNIPFIMNTGGSGVFQVDNLGTNLSLNGAISGGGGLIKTGAGNLTVAGPTTFAGNTTVSAGTLFLGPSVTSLASPRITVAGGAALNVTNAPSSTLNLTSTQTLSGTGTVTGTIFAGSGSTIAPGNFTTGNASSGVLTVSNLTLDGGSQLTLGLVAGNPLNSYVSTTNLTFTNSGNVVLNLFNPDQSTPFATAGTYDLLQFTNLTGVPAFSLGTSIPGLTPSFAMVAGPGGTFYEQLTLTPSGAQGVWVGPTTNANWSNPNNWQGGVVPQVAGDQATFGTAGTPGTVTLDVAETVGAVTFNNAGGSYAVTGSQLLTLDGSGNGAAVRDVAGTHSIGTNISLNDSTSVTVSAGAQLTLSGTISSTSTSKTLKFDGAGTAIISGPNTFGPATGTVGTTLSGGGTLQLASNTALSTGDLAVTGASALRAGAAVSIANNVRLSAPLIVDSATTTMGLTGNITDTIGTNSVTIKGTGSVTFSGVNTYSGQTIVSSGVLNAASDTALGSSTGVTTGVLLNPDSGTAAINFTSAAPVIGSLASTGAGASSVVLGNSTTGAATTLSVGANNTSTTFAGVIGDRRTTIATAVGNLTKVGTGALTLTNANTYAGLTTVNNGTIIAATDTALGNNSTLTSSGLLLNPTAGTTAAVNFTSATPAIASLASLDTGSSLIVLGNGTAVAPTTLTIGGSNTNTNFAGVISDVNSTTARGNLVVTGMGELTLSGANTFHGSTTIGSTATLVVGATNALQFSTLDYSTGVGTLRFTGVTTAALGSLSGNKDLVLANSDQATGVFLTVGSAGGNQTFSGNLTGLGGLNKAGGGELTLTSANYTGNTTTSGGTLTITGGAVGSSTAIVNVATGTTGLKISAGSITAQTLNIGLGGGQTNASALINGSAVATFGNVTIGSGGNTAGGLFLNSTGAVSLGVVALGKDSGSAAANTGGGLVVQGGQVTATSIAGAISGTGGRSADLNITGGALTVGSADATGSFSMGGGGGSTGAITQTGGTLTYLGADGLILDPVGGSLTASGIYNLSGATSVGNFAGITLNAQNGATTTARLSVTGGATLNLGAVGLVANTPSATVTATFGTATVGATADWTSTAPIILSGNTTLRANDGVALTPTAHNITLSGVLSGTGGLTKTGAGIVTLSGANVYTGTTAVAQGDLVLRNDGVNNAHAPVLTGGGTDITGGRLVLDYSGGGTDPAADIAAFNGRFLAGQFRDTANQSLAPVYIDDTANSRVNIFLDYRGDSNLNGTVDMADFTVLSNNFGQTTTGLWATGDFNYDGTVNALDFNAVAANFGKPLLPPQSPAALLGTLVPEPATLGVIGLALGMTTLRRRRRA